MQECLTVVVLSLFIRTLTAATTQYQQMIMEKTKDLRCSAINYSGPRLDAYFLQHFEDNSPQLSYIYIPIFWTDCRNQLQGQDGLDQYKKTIEQFFEGLDRSRTYFTLMQHADGFAPITIPSDLRLVVFDSGGAVAVAHPYDLNIITIPIPLLKQELQPSYVEKKRLGTFVGTIATEHRGTDTRPRLLALYNGTFDFAGHREDWPAFMESGQFSLAPRGYGPTSFRLYESLQLGLIPIYVWERFSWLPYQELIDWDDIAIIVGRPFIRSIDRLVRDAPVAAMRQKILQVRHMFTYQYTAEYIVRILKEADLFSEKAADPVANS